MFSSCWLIKCSSTKVFASLTIWSCLVRHAWYAVNGNQRNGLKPVTSYENLSRFWRRRLSKLLSLATFSGMLRHFVPLVNCLVRGSLSNSGTPSSTQFGVFENMPVPVMLRSTSMPWVRRNDSSILTVRVGVTPVISNACCLRFATCVISSPELYEVI